MATTQLYTLSLHDALPIFLHAFPVEGVDDVARTHARPRGRAVFRHVRHDDAGVERQVERFGEHAGDGLGADADLAAPHASGLANLLEHVPDDVARGGEADSLAAPRL